MAGVRWKRGAVISFWVKHDVRVLAQMLEEPYLMIYDTFTTGEKWHIASLEEASELFCCAVTRQFLKYSKVQKENEINPSRHAEVPPIWIESHHGSRWLTLWKGSPDETELCTLSARPGGRLVRHLKIGGRTADNVVLIENIQLDDEETIENYELDVVWTFPVLNERLHYCYLEGRVLDPHKDLQFDRPIDKKYKTMVHIWAAKGTPKDWGYD